MESCQRSAWAHSEPFVTCQFFRQEVLQAPRVRQGPSLEELTVTVEAGDRDRWQFACAVGQGSERGAGWSERNSPVAGEESEGIGAGS